MFHITIARNEPVINVCASKCCLYGFQEEYSVHYIRTVRSSERWKQERVAYRVA